MVGRIGDTISTELNPSGLQQGAASAATRLPEVGEQVQNALFGRPKPPLLDPAAFPQLAEQLNLLRKYRKKLAIMAGDSESDYEVVLADGPIAMIDEDGTIYVGAGFLAACAQDEAVLVGVLAHEIGHRPKRWRHYSDRRSLSREELEAMCRFEETRADIFAGRALAEMGLDCAPLEQFLLAVQQQPHPEYFDAPVRAEIIREAHRAHAYRSKGRRKLFPEYDRMRAAKGHLGDY